MIRPIEYWNAVAKSVEAENAKASLYVRHKPSLGVAREAILKHELRKETRAPFLTKTGFVVDTGTSEKGPPQCDILVYDPARCAPIYETDEFVVVAREAALCVVEVKTTLEQKPFLEMIQVSEGMGQYGYESYDVPVLSFAFDGVKFETFLRYVAECAPRFSRLPRAIAVHDANYIGIWPQSSNGLPHDRYYAAHFPPECGTGAALAAFLSIYNQVVERKAISTATESEWRTQFNLPEENLASITADGKIHQGRILV